VLVELTGGMLVIGVPMWVIFLAVIVLIGWELYRSRVGRPGRRIVKRLRSRRL